MSRIINRLVEDSGGWEVFLYKTLAEVVNKVGQNGFTGEGENAVNDAQEILNAYEELDGGRSDEVEETTKHVRVTPVIKTMKTESVVVPAEDVEWKLEDITLTPLPRPAPKSKRLKARVRVDAEVGASQGDLPLPAKTKIVNRQNIAITTMTGQHLAASSKQSGHQGQIQSKHVSGHVSDSGAYRLVFKDTTLGSALIQFDVEPIPSKLTKNQFEGVIAVANKLSIEELRERLDHFGMIYVRCNCGLSSCFGWKLVDHAVIEEAEAQRKGRLEAAHKANAMGGVR